MTSGRTAVQRTGSPQTAASPAIEPADHAPRLGLLRGPDVGSVAAACNFTLNQLEPAAHDSVPPFVSWLDVLDAFVELSQNALASG